MYWWRTGFFSWALIWRNFELQDVARPLPEKSFTSQCFDSSIELGEIVASQYNDGYLPFNIFANVDPKCLGFRFAGVKPDDLDSNLNTSSSSDRSTSTGASREIFLSGGTLNCRTSLDPCPKNHSPLNALTLASNFLKSILFQYFR